MKNKRPSSLLLGLSCLSLNTLVQAEPIFQKDDHVVIIGNTFADQLRNHGYLETLLVKELNITLKNLAWGGDSITQRDRPTNFPAEKGRLDEHKTDVIIACFGMSESFAGKEGIDLFKADLEKLLKLYQGQTYNDETPVKIVLVSPIAYEDLGPTTPNIESRNQDLALYSKAMEEVAKQLEIGFVDLYQPTKKLFSLLQETQLTSNGIHLNSIGYWAISGDFYQQLTKAKHTSFSLNIDAKNLSSKASGLEVLNLKRENKIMNFQVGKERTHFLKPPQSHQSSAEIKDLKSGKLQINNLEKGSHTLTVDGKKIATATATEWMRGITIDQTPAHKALEDLRLKINDKNLQFVYSWKALNQVHIVGERKSSQSGKELPKEVIAFNELSKKNQHLISGSSKNQTSNWSISPATPE